MSQCDVCGATGPNPCDSCLPGCIHQPTIHDFMRAVDSKMAAHFGLTSSDLEDYPWNDYFEPGDGDGPAYIDDAASEAVAMWAYDHGFDGSPSTYTDQHLVGVDDVANSDAASPF